MVTPNHSIMKTNHDLTMSQPIPFQDIYSNFRTIIEDMKCGPNERMVFVSNMILKDGRHVVLSNLNLNNCVR